MVFSLQRFSRIAWLPALILICLLGWAEFWRDARKLPDRAFRIGVNNAPPYYALHPDGTFSGLAVDVINEAARRRAITLEWVPGASLNPDRDLASRRLDLWPVLSITPERAKKIHLTAPWMKNSFCVLSLLEREVKTASEAAGIKVAYAAFPLATKMAKRFFHASDLVPKPHPKEVVQAVCRGEVAAGFLEARTMDPLILARPADCENAKFGLHFVKGAVADAAIASTPEASRVADAIRSEISNLVDDGTLAASMDKWDAFSSGESRSLRALQRVERRSVYFLYALIAVLIGAALLYWQFREARIARGLAQRASLLEMDRNRVLETLASSESISELLSGVSALVERQCTGAVCCVSVREGDKLKLVCPSRLPAGLARSLAEIDICELGGSAGSAPFSGSLTVFTDMLHDGRWQSRLTEVEASGFQTSCAQPVYSGSGRVLGLIAMFLPNAASGSQANLRVLESAAHLALVVMERWRLVEQLQHQANHDGLTGLPNRALLLERLRQGLATAANRKRHLAVLCIDLDRFKQINDVLGHGAGDQFLQTITGIIRQSLRTCDTLARMGGDEFTVLLEDIESAGAAGALAQRLVDAVRQPVRIEGVELFGSASIGVSVFPKHGITAEELQRNADNAMYHAKTAGKNQFQFFDWEMDRSTNEGAGVERDLREALDNDYFELHYQPQFSNAGELIGAEALIRMRHPARGLISPVKFIPRAEETGLVVPIGDWVIHEVCRQIADWQRRGLRPVRVAVNVSALQLSRPEFAGTMATALARHGIAPELLELELTETAIMRNTQESMRQLRDLKELGLRLAIDDFGTGYSSLSYLQQLPVNTVKIDKSFIQEAAPSGRALPLVQAIVAASRSLGLTVIAEGVETVGQYESVCAAGCDAIQGFLLGKPVCPTEFEGVLHAQIARSRAHRDQTAGIAYSFGLGGGSSRAVTLS